MNLERFSPEQRDAIKFVFRAFRQRRFQTIDEAVEALPCASSQTLLPRGTWFSPAEKRIVATIFAEALESRSKSASDVRLAPQPDPTTIPGNKRNPSAKLTPAQKEPIRAHVKAVLKEQIRILKQALDALPGSSTSASAVSSVSKTSTNTHTSSLVKREVSTHNRPVSTLDDENTNPTRVFGPGRSQWCGLIRLFLEKTYDEWMSTMVNGYQYVNPHDDISESKQQSWAECYQPMRDALSDLIRRNPAFGLLGLVFEYALPMHDPSRSNKEGLLFLDAAVVGQNAIALLEFKMWTDKRAREASDKSEDAASQVSRYRTILKQQHKESRSMAIRPFVVMCREKRPVSRIVRSNYREPVTFVSPSSLADSLWNCFRGRPQKLKSFTRWRQSPWGSQS